MTQGTRITKDPEIRREELIDAAEKLFEKNGYDETAVSDIVKEVGVAQGTFYHYFGSKDEILKALSERIAAEVVTKVKALMRTKDLSALDKMLALTDIFRTIAIGRGRMTDLLHEDRNAYIHHMLERRVMPPVVDGLTAIIKEGIAEGKFDTPYPREAAIAIIGISQQFSEGRHDEADVRMIEMEELSRVLEMIERVLGARKGLLMKYYGRTR